MCRVLFNANHQCMQSNNDTFLLKTNQQTKKNNISGCAQMVPLTRVFSVCSINVPRLHGASHCECVSPCTARGCSSRWCYDQPVHRVTSPFWQQGVGNQRARPRGLPPQFSSLPSIFLSFSPLPLLLVDLPTSEHHQVILAVSPLIFLLSFIVLTLSHSGLPSSPSSLYSPTPWSDLHCGGSVSQASCYQSARGRWDDERASERASVWAFVRKWLLPRCFDFGGCVCVCVSVCVCHRPCLHVCVSAIIHTDVCISFCPAGRVQL